ncbi:P-loop containing nucleoside triphosphate hydrolase protein [Mycena galericulata]|nr:P-loop containing nucleoside triphosphate hydrolase protein [Mycena galericulata]
MFVFNQGFWKKDQNLADSIAAVHRDDLVLDDKVLNGLQRDVESFFNSQSLYEDLKVVWKRGLLLTGPPGNGKSHTIKLLVKNSKATCLYVRSTRGSSRHGIGTEECIAAIFKKARKTTPCLLVLEDLDSLIEASIRTFFLNELDGFAVNNGVLILASSNNPELIDPAVNRPSRFDVIYSFEPPTYELRCRYSTKWLTKISELRGNRSLSSPLQDPEELAKRIAQKTEGFSYAYMKELFLSFLFGLAHSGGKNADNLETQLFLQIRHLREQLANISDQKKKKRTRMPAFLSEPVAHFGLIGECLVGFRTCFVEV